MEGYNKWIDGLPKVVRIIFAFFPIFFGLYRLFNCILAKDFGDKFVFTIIIFIVYPISVVYDLICLIKWNKPAVSWTLADANVVDAKCEEKKEEKKSEEK